MSLATYTLPEVFTCAVELAQAAAAYRPEDYPDVPVEVLDYCTDENWSDKDGRFALWQKWHGALDAIVLASNRLKRAMGATGPLDVSDQLRARTEPAWEGYQNRFKYAAHSQEVRQALWKLANAAVDLSGFATIRNPDLLLRERGQRLLGQGLAQLWTELTLEEREKVKVLLVRCHEALGWPSNPKIEPPPYQGPVDGGEADNFREIDIKGGFATRPLGSLDRPEAASASALDRNQKSSSPQTGPSEAPGSSFSQEDLERALKTLINVFEDHPWEKAEARLKQNTLIEELRERGVGRGLALALINDLLSRNVFQAGESFVDLKIFVRLDGKQTDEVTPNRYLHVARENWFRYLASRKTAGAQSDTGNADGEPERPPASPPVTPAQGKNVWRKEGEIWSLVFDGKSVQLKDLLGLKYIAELIAKKGRQVSAYELNAMSRGPSTIRPSRGSEVLDKDALKDYRSRYEDLHDQLEEAKRNNDPVRQEKLQNELEALARQLSSAKGLGGRKQRMGSDAQKIRKSASNAITRAIRTIRKSHPILAKHLESSIQLGSWLAYSPANDVDWAL